MDWIEMLGNMLPALGPEFVIGGIILSGIIVAVVQLLKEWFKLPTKYAPWVAFGLTSVAYVVTQLIAANLIEAGAVEGLLTILVVFLTVTGFYDRAKGTVRWARRNGPGI